MCPLFLYHTSMQKQLLCNSTSFILSDPVLPFHSFGTPPSLPRLSSQPHLLIYAQTALLYSYHTRPISTFVCSPKYISHELKQQKHDEDDELECLRMLSLSLSVVVAVSAAMAVNEKDRKI